MRIAAIVGSGLGAHRQSHSAVTAPIPQKVRTMTMYRVSSASRNRIAPTTSTAARIGSSRTERSRTCNPSCAPRPELRPPSAAAMVRMQITCAPCRPPPPSPPTPHRWRAGRPHRGFHPLQFDAVESCSAPNYQRHKHWIHAATRAARNKFVTDERGPAGPRMRHAACTTRTHHRGPRRMLSPDGRVCSGNKWTATGLGGRA